VTIRFTQEAAVDPEKLARFVAAQPGAQFSPSGMLKFSLKTTHVEEVLPRLERLLEELAGEQKPVSSL